MNKKEIAKKVGKISLFALKFIVVLLLIIGIAGVTVAAVITTEVINNVPKYDGDNFLLDDQTIIYDKNGDEIATIGQKRHSLSFDEIPEVLVHAILAIEDSRFFSHDGVDKPRFLKASLELGKGGGGSTLTMQASKNAYTRIDDTEETTKEKIERKIQDIYVSMFVIENKYTKEEIFSFYVNSHYLGNFSWGIEAASHNYFNKSATELNLAEASFIAGLFQRPNDFDPSKIGGAELGEKRRNQVLDLMAMHGFISEEQADLTKQIPLTSYLNMSNSFNQTDSIYTDYINTVVAEAREETGMDPYAKPMQIYTNMNPQAQEHLYNIKNGDYYADEKMQIAVTVVDNSDGTIAGVISGREINEVGFNYATALNQPGSTSKPYMDYAPCFEYGNCVSTRETIADEKYRYSNGQPIENWDFKYKGTMTLESALALSRNIPALKLFQRQTPTQTLDFIQGLDMNPELGSEGELVEAHSIGGYTGESTVSIAGAYSSFARGGQYTKPKTINKIILNYNSKEPEEFSLVAPTTKAMKESTADAINQMLSVSSAYSFGGTYRGYGINFALKTGTSNWDKAKLAAVGLNAGSYTNGSRDNWIALYSPQFTTSLWVGYDELSPEYVQNGWYFTPSNNPSTFKYGIAKDIVLGPHQPREWLSFPAAGTANNAKVQKEVAANGDEDKDGIKNSEDQCEDTPPNTEVDETGCAVAPEDKDTDGDGVNDEDDKCPTTSGPASNDGCPLPKDTDGDGVIDKDDKCPTTSGPASNDGCPTPKDSDNDGISDEKDECPLEAGTAAYNGCPPPKDSDSDGINDDKDECPFEAAPNTSNGCLPEETDSSQGDINNYITQYRIVKNIGLSTI